MTAYVIFGYEWATEEKGAAPEVCRYKVLEISYTANSWLQIQVNNEFLCWKDSIKEEIWKEVIGTPTIASYHQLAEMFKSFDKSSSSSWYFLNEEEFQEWKEWAEGEGAGEVEIGSLSFVDKLVLRGD